MVGVKLKIGRFVLVVEIGAALGVNVGRLVQIGQNGAGLKGSLISKSLIWAFAAHGARGATNANKQASQHHDPKHLNHSNKASRWQSMPANLFPSGGGREWVSRCGPSLWVHR